MEAASGASGNPTPESGSTLAGDADFEAEQSAVVRGGLGPGSYGLLCWHIIDVLRAVI